MYVLILTEMLQFVNNLSKISPQRGRAIATPMPQTRWGMAVDP